MNKTYLWTGLSVGILAITVATAAFAANSNYGAWKTIMGNNGGRGSKMVTEQNFDQFTNMHKQMAEGNYAEAQKIRTELGMGQSGGKRGGGCGKMSGQTGGCQKGSAGAKRDANFVDANKNGTCDHAEQIVK